MTVPDVLKQPSHTNDIWSLVFMHDQTSDGQSYSLWNIIDDYEREGLAMEVGLSLPASRVIRTLNQLLEYRTHNMPYAVIMDLSLPIIIFILGYSTTLIWLSNEYFFKPIPIIRKRGIKLGNKLCIESESI